MTHLDEGKELYTNLVVTLIERIAEKGTSFNQLSRLSGVDVSTVSRIMNGKCIPTFPVLYALYKAVDLQFNVGGILDENYSNRGSKGTREIDNIPYFA